MKNYTTKGQISLEFLVILFAMVAILLVFMPIFSKLHKTVLFGIDVYNASNSLQEFKTNVSMLNTLDVDSSFVFNVHFINPVSFNCNLNIAKFVIFLKDKNKPVSIGIDLNCDNFNEDLNKKASFLVTKQSDLNISVISN